MKLLSLCTFSAYQLCNSPATSQCCFTFEMPSGSGPSLWPQKPSCLSAQPQQPPLHLSVLSHALSLPSVSASSFQNTGLVPDCLGLLRWLLFTCPVQLLPLSASSLAYTTPTNTGPGLQPRPCSSHLHLCFCTSTCIGLWSPSLSFSFWPILLAL